MFNFELCCVYIYIYFYFKVVETGFGGGLIGPKGTRPKSVFVSGSLYAANGPLAVEGKTYFYSIITCLLSLFLSCL